MFVRFAGRLMVNVASLNAQGGAGTNYIEITKVPVVLRNEDELVVEEVPAISGNMIKHFHFVNLVDLLRESQHNSEKLSKDDLRYVAYRFREKRNDEINIGDEKANLKNEGDILTKFAVADIHGYLAPETQNRRESLVKLSFVIPVEETIKKSFDIAAVTQNRVIIDENGNIVGGSAEEGKAMMVFKRQYASALYGFSSTFDAYYTGRPLSNPNTIAVSNTEERKERVKLAILAFVNLLSGRFGANTSRGLPALEVDQLMAVISKNPIPMAKHGFYTDYIGESVKILRDYANTFNVDVDVLIYSKNDIEVAKSTRSDDRVTITHCGTYVELLHKVAEKAESSVSAEK